MNRNFPGLDNDFRSDSGQTLVLVALSMVVLMGFLGLAIDVGNLRAAQHKMQQTADAAALAGALEMAYCSSGSPCTKMTNDATKAVTENGLSTPTMSANTCSGTGTGVALFINWGPCLLSNDPNKGSSAVVEALVAQNQDMYFARVMGLTKVRLSARAEAGRGPSSGCDFIGTKDFGTLPGGGSLSVASGGKLILGCGVQDDGSLDAKGNGSHVTATEFQVSGSSGNGSNQFYPAPVFNAPQVPDPICQSYSDASLTKYNSTSACLTQVTYIEPTPSNQSYTCQTYSGTTTSGALSPGCYSAPSSGCTPVDVSKNGYGNDVNNACDAIKLGANVTLSPGVYIFNGDLDLNGYNLSGTGVTLYFASSGTTTQIGSLITSQSSKITLSAPTAAFSKTSDYTGMLIWQAPDDANTIQLASGTGSMWNGIIYGLSATLDMSDGSNAEAGCTGSYTIIDVYKQEFAHGTKTFNVCADYSSLANGNPIQGYTAVLVQ